MDKWHGMTMEDIRALEEETKKELDEERAKVIELQLQPAACRLQCWDLIVHILGGTERDGCPG